MKAKLIVYVLVTTAAIAASAAFDDAERSAARKVIAAAEAKFRSAGALDERAITLLPVKGDDDGYCERLIVGALVNAGKVCVVSNDEKKDDRFRRILNEIKWDERQTTLKSIDPSTADELGKLKSTQILMEARLVITRRGRKRRAVAELDLLAYAVSTKQYVWTAHIAVDDAGRGWPDPAEFNVKVSFTGEKSAESVAALVASKVRNAVAGYGYRVNADGGDDLALTLSITKEEFDRSGGYFVYRGKAAARLASRVGDGILYERVFSAKGGRALGELEASQNLADALAEQVLKWLDETLAPRAFFAKHSDFMESSVR